MEVELGIATTDQLMDELFKRFKAVLLAAIVNPGNTNKDPKVTGCVEIWARGGTINAIGLCRVAEDALKTKVYGGDDNEDE